MMIMIGKNFASAVGAGDALAVAIDDHFDFLGCEKAVVGVGLVA